MTETLSLILGFLGLCVTQYVLWEAGRRRSDITDDMIEAVGISATSASSNADTAAVSAELAAERSKPTSNGFAEEMRDGMGAMLQSQHILTEGQTELATEIHEIRRDLARHLGDHARHDLSS